MYDCEEDRVSRISFAVRVKAIAENEAKGIGCLMPSTSSLHLIWFFSIGESTETRLLVRICQICRGQAVSKEFSKGAASGSTARVGEIVVDIRLATGREEEKPVLFDL